MAIKFIMIFVFILTVFSCSENQNLTQPVVSSIDDKLEELRYFPLAKGDYWEYRSVESGGGSITEYRDTLFYSIEILGEKTLDNKKYWKIYKTEIYSSSWKYSSGLTVNPLASSPKVYYVRVDLESGLIYRKTETDSSISSESTILNVIDDVGDTFLGHAPSFNRDVGETPFTLMSISLDKKTVIKNYEQSGWNYSFKVAKDIGFISSSYGGGSYTWAKGKEELLKSTIY